MKTRLFQFAAVLVLAFIVTGCGRSEGEDFFPTQPAPFKSEIGSLEIVGEVDDPAVTEVEVDGVVVPVAGGEISSVVETTGKSSIEIKATDPANNTATKVIEIK